jgi:predicted PhzF superfamily epimerase YddE/YHI9
MRVPVVRVDAFTDIAFRGNPAAVVLLDSPRDATWRQDVARELNQPATAFVTPGSDGFDLSWFTATTELVLCGHGTLATAHVLWETGRLPGSAAARFTTKSGVLGARRDGAWIELDFPAEPVRLAVPPPALLEALGVTAKAVGRNRLDWLVEVESEQAVLEIAPDLRRLSAVETRGAIVTSRASTKGYDVVSRFFAPRAGIDEDFVTGSAHCALGPYWAEQIRRRELVGYQASARGGMVRMRPAGDRVTLAGRARTILRGELFA